MKGKLAVSFIGDIARVTRRAEVTRKSGTSVPFQAALGEALALIRKSCRSGRKIIFIGNGGSAAIAAHMAIDYWKNGGFPALTFNEPSLLTCISNDYGYEWVFDKPVRRFASAGDVLVAISSSGKSPNILNGVKAGRDTKCRVITLSGFGADNPLRRTGDLNFYVKSHSYGVVEIAHLSILHSILEESMLSARP